MRPFLLSCGTLWVLMFIVLRSPVAAESLPHTLHPQISSQSYYLVDSEYLPQIKQDIATLVEWGSKSQFSLLTAPGLRLQLGGEFGSIRQKNDLVGDDDYALKRKSFFAGFSLVKGEHFSAQGKISFEAYANDGQSGYYRLQDDENLVTGLLNWTWKSEPWRITGKYYRARETDSIYDVASGRALLNLETQGLAGVELGYQFHPAWETALSLYHESYGTDQIDQFNINGQIAFRTQFAALSRVAAGVGYYLEEKETIVNLTVEGGDSNREKLSFGWSGEVEWADIDRSVLLGGSVWCRLGLNKYAALKLQLQGEQEIGDDRDSLLAAYLALNVHF